MSRAEGIRLSASWAAVIISILSLAVAADIWKGQILYAPKGDYATQADVAKCATRTGMDSLETKLDSMSAKQNLMLTLLRHADQPRGQSRR